MKILLMIAGCLTIHLSILVCIHRIAISLLKKPRDSQKMIPSQGLATKVVVFQYLVAMLIGVAAWFSGYLSLGWLLYLNPTLTVVTLILLPLIAMVVRATGKRLIAANATGCLEVFSTPYPESSWQLPWIHSLFGNAAATFTCSRRRASRQRTRAVIGIASPDRSTTSRPSFWSAWFVSE